MLGALAAFLLAISGLNVLNSYVARDFMTAIEQRDRDGFTRQAMLVDRVFAASTVVPSSTASASSASAFCGASGSRGARRLLPRRPDVRVPDHERRLSNPTSASPRTSRRSSR
jgi:hypothetical protein